MFFIFSFSALHIYLPIRQFFYDIIHPEYSPVCDVYALMFLVDVVNFIITIYGYWAFGVRFCRLYINIRVLTWGTLLTLMSYFAF